MGRLSARDCAGLLAWWLEEPRALMFSSNIDKEEHRFLECSGTQGSNSSGAGGGGGENI